MYNNSLTKEKIDSLSTLLKLESDLICSFNVSETILPAAKNKNIVVYRHVNGETYSMMSFIYNDDFVRIHFELNNFYDNELIVDLQDFAQLSLLNNQKIVHRYDEQKSYFQIIFDNVDSFDKFFDTIVWPSISNILSDPF